MAKTKKKYKPNGKSRGIMGRSDIPYAQRLTMAHKSNIVNNRDHAVKIAMYCNSVAMNELEGIGYKRLVRYHHRFKQVVEAFYEDGTDVGMAHAKKRFEQMGMPISGEFYSVVIDGATKKEQEIQTNRLHAAQVALICGAIAMNDEFGFGQERQERISIRAQELSDEYSKKGAKPLLDKMQKIGFFILDGEAIAFTDDNGEAITYKQWKELKGL